MEYLKVGIVCLIKSEVHLKHIEQLLPHIPLVYQLKLWLQILGKSTLVSTQKTLKCLEINFFHLTNHPPIHLFIHPLRSVYNIYVYVYNIIYNYNYII